MLKTEVVCEPTFNAEFFSTGMGRRERPYAFTWLLVVLKMMSVEYAHNCNAHHCNLVAAREGTLILGPNIVNRGL